MMEREREEERAQEAVIEGQAARRGVPGRVANSLAHACRWLQAPDEVGEPVILQPTHVRLALLLAAGYLVLVGLLGVALHQASRMPDAATVAMIPALPTAVPEVTVLPGPTPTALGSGGGIAFSLRRHGNTDLYALDQNTGELIRLTHHPAEDRAPAWSPDGEYLAFASNRADNWDIYLLDLVSGSLIRLTHHPDYDGDPCWSPDGQRLAFETYRDGNLNIYVMTAGGEHPRPVTTDLASDFAPAWAPEDDALAFVSLRDGGKDVYVYTEEEERVVNVTHSPDLAEDQPAWSGDGSRLAYVTGNESQTSVQVAVFDWESLSVDQARTEFFGTGAAPAWAPDGESLLYVYARGGRSHLVAASMAGWALFHEVYSAQGLLDDIAWTDAPLPPRVAAWAGEVDDSRGEGHLPASINVEVVQPTPAEGPPYQLMSLPGVRVEEGAPRLSDQVNDSFNALRRRVSEEAGWDYLARLDSAWLPLTHEPPSGHSRRSWQLCGRAFALDQDPLGGEESGIVLVREDVGNATYWRVYLRAAQQDGTLGEPLRVLPWDLLARERGGRAEVDGGARSDRVPAGYYVDFTALAQEYGWERVPSMWRWRYFWPDILWWEYRKTGDMTWWDCMLSVLEPTQIESAFGPIPGREE